MTIVWDGVTDPTKLGENELANRHTLANAARDFDWTHMLTVLRKNPNLVNATRPGGASLFAPLHQVACGGAPVAVASELVRLGAWRTLQNARGERPEDVAVRCGQDYLRTALTPVLKCCVPMGVLLRIEAGFHGVIRSRIKNLASKALLRLPVLEPLLELKLGAEPVWFGVPGMYGGFSYHLRSDGVEAVLVSESWCRVASGSGQRHEVTSAGAKLVEEGFV